MCQLTVFIFANYSRIKQLINKIANNTYQGYNVWVYGNFCLSDYFDFLTRANLTLINFKNLIIHRVFGWRRGRYSFITKRKTKSKRNKNL